MALSNAEKQARWRERHILKRRAALRIVNLLVRKHLADTHVEQIAALLNEFLNQHGVRSLRRALKPLTDEQIEQRNAAFREQLEHDWLHGHPGMTAKDYRRLSTTDVVKWQQTKAASERQ